MHFLFNFRPLALNPMRDTIDEITSGLGIVKPVWPLDNSVNERYF